MKKAARTLVSVVCAFALFLPSLAGLTAKADTSPTFHLRVEGATQTYLDEQAPYVQGQSLEDAIKTALDTKKVAYTDNGGYFSSIGNESNSTDPNNWYPYWSLYQNGESAAEGAATLKYAAGDEIVFAFIGSDTLYPKISFSPAAPVAGQSVALTVKADKTTYGDASTNYAATTTEVAIEGAAVTFAGQKSTTDTNGSVTFTAPAAGSYTYSVSKENTPLPDLVRTGEAPVYVYAQTNSSGAANIADIPGHALDVTVTDTAPAAPVALPVTQSGDTVTGTVPAEGFSYTVRKGAQRVSYSLPANLTATGPVTWDGTLIAPTLKTNSQITLPNGGIPRLAVQVGVTGTDLTLSGFATVTLAGQAGQKAGYFDAEGHFTALSTDSTSGQPYYTDDGKNLVIYTNHFSTFVAYSDSTQATPAVLKQAAQGAAGVLANDLSDWSAFALTRAGYAAPSGYLSQAAAVLQQTNGNPGGATDLAKYVLTLRAAGADPTHFNGYNLVSALYRADVDTSTTLNATFALLALDSDRDSADYTPPAGAKVTKSALVAGLLADQQSDGGFALSAGLASDVDITAMALSALAPHIGEDGVQAAVDNGLAFLSGRQQADGGFVPMGSSDESAESAAQVVIALSSLNLNAASDARFVKNSKSPLDSLLTFRQADGGFAHTAGSGTNIIATQQALEALAAYARYTGGNQYTLYDLRDAKHDIQNVTPAQDDSAADTTSNPQTGYPGQAGQAAPAVLVLLLAAASTAACCAARRRK